MGNRVLLVVDVQLTFCEGGALGVTGGNDLAVRIADYIAANRDRYSRIISTQDWHIDPGPHFSKNPDFVDTWPIHGVADTPQAELHPALADIVFSAQIKKGQYAAAYSAFEGADDSGLSLKQILEESETTAVDIVGIAESHCVLQTALDSQKIGYPTTVYTDLTVPVSPESGAAARKQMTASGIRLEQSPQNCEL